MSGTSRVVLLGVSAAAAALLLLSAAAAVGPVPASAVAAMRKAAGANAFLPTSVPAGYHYVGWKNNSPNQIPFNDVPWLIVTFDHGGTKLLWTIFTLAGGAASDEDVCKTLSVGHTTVAGATVYWGPMDTYEPLGSGPKGRHLWRCSKSAHAGVGGIKLDVFDQHAALAIPVVAGMIARASNG